MGQTDEGTAKMEEGLVDVRPALVADGQAAVLPSQDRVDTTRDAVVGQGTQRRHVRRVVVLYRLLVKGTADAHGRFSRRVAIAYQPRTPLLVSIAVTVRLPQGTATGRATATLLPRRHR
jgi:hypothetical protein